MYRKKILALSMLLTAMLVYESGSYAQDDDLCLTETTDNKISTAEDLVSNLQKDFMEADDFNNTIKVMDKYSACPEHEPGSDVYYILKSVHAQKQTDESVAVQFEVSGQLIDKTGSKQWKFVAQKTIKKFTYTLYPTNKGLRMGNEHQLILTNGLFMTSKAASGNFGVQIPD